MACSCRASRCAPCEEDDRVAGKCSCHPPPSDGLQLTGAERAGAEQQGAADVGGGPEIDPLQPELPGGPPEAASEEGGSGAAKDAQQANTECYGAGQEHEPLAQKPSLDASPGASAAAAAAAGERMRKGE